MPHTLPRFLIAGLTVLGALAHAAEGPVTISLEDARRALGEPPNFAQLQYAPLALHLTEASAGLRVPRKMRHDHEIRSAGAFAPHFHRRYGFTLGLTSTVDGVDVPAFDGLVFDAHDDVIANFSIKTVLGANGVEREFGKVVTRIQRFAALRNWALHLMTSTEEAIYGHANIVSRLSLHTPYYQRQFHRTAERYRRMIEIFGVGTGRPTWILLNVLSDLLPNDQELTRMQNALRDGTAVTHVLIKQRGRLTLIRPKKIVSYPPCDELLADAAE